MKKSLFTLVCLAAMLAADTGLKAQEITVTLNPGWNWISYPNAVAMDVATALGGFTPAPGDIINSQYSSATYSGGRWRGGLTHLIPGWGYMYYSARTELAELVFTQASDASVATATPTDITAVSAVVGGMVTLPEGSHVFLRGVCWGTAPNPDIDRSHTTAGTGIGSFSDALEGLNPSTTYYVRAYASNSYVTIYGGEVSFTTEAGGSGGNAPTGAIDGLFSVSATSQVYFSQGNLQYQASTNTWRFAEHQYSYEGSSNSSISQTNSGWIDLFGWGTSGWNNGNTYYHPWDTDNSSGSSYGPPGSYNLTGSYANADWGVYNPISNGGNQANQWRTLTQPEWAYIFNTRTTSSGIRYAKAKVNNVNGVILLPDDWSTSYYTLSNTNSSSASFSSNIISATQWSTLEQHGAVFLPAAGGRRGTSVYAVGGFGYYWSASYGDSGYAFDVYFGGSYLGPQSSGSRYDGFSVRLARVAE